MLIQKAKRIALLIFVLTAVFRVGDKPSSGQQQFPQSNRKPACTIFCGDPSPVPKVNYFWLFTKEEEKAGKCYGGPLPADRANDYYNNDLSAEQRSAMCQNLASTTHEPTRACPTFQRLAWLCKNEPPKNEPPKNDCKKPTPWFGNSTNCKDVQGWLTEMRDREVTLSVCGAPIFRNVVPSSADLTTYLSDLVAWVTKSTGTKVCCDRFREAARTSVPCDPRADVDCDSRPNETDTASPNPESGTLYPVINRLFSEPDEEIVDPLPKGLDPDNTEFFPPQDKCDCKWELVKGTLTCSTDGRQPHVYQARWRCPSTGNERFTRKEARATAPCTPPRR